MPTVLKPGNTVGRYTVSAKLDQCVSTHRYAVRADGLTQDLALHQYMTTGSAYASWEGAAQARQALRAALDAAPDAARAVLSVHDLLHNAEVNGRPHPECLLITEALPPSLAEWLEAEPRSAAHRLALAAHLAKGLAALHEAGLVWVLIDPHNIGVRSDDSTCFTDFFCASLRDDVGAMDVPDPMSVPGYGAPEQEGGEHVTPASDVYSLGRVILHLLSDSPRAADGESPGATLEDASRSLAALLGAGSDDAAKLLRAALSTDAANRPTAMELAHALGADVAPDAASPRLPEVPGWLLQPLQSLAFWVGYQHQVYRHHLLPEGAIVAEFTRLVDGEVGLDRIVVREPMYRTLVPAGTTAVATDRTRADLAVRQKSQAADKPGAVEAVVEVKRAGNARGVIDGDLVALHALKRSAPDLRVFLLLVSQAAWPRDWVNQLGTARRDVEVVACAGTEGGQVEVPLRVRRVAKASASFRMIQSASYCCLIEVG